MVTLITRLYKMGCILCCEKRSNDDYPKKAQSNVSSSGRFVHQSTNPGNYSQLTGDNFGNLSKVALETSTKSILPQNSTDRKISTYHEGSQLFENVYGNPRSVFGGSSLDVKEHRVFPPSNTTNLESYNSVGSHNSRSAVVHQVNEHYKKSSLRNRDLFSVNSLPNTRLAKTPVNNQGLKSYLTSSHDSYLNSQKMPRMNVQDPYGRNSYLYLNQNKSSVYPTKERQSLMQQEMNTGYSELPGPSSNTDNPMETDSSQKRAITSYDPKHFGNNLVDNYNIEIDSTISKRFKVAHPEKEPLSNETILTELEFQLHKRYIKLLTSREVHNFYFEVFTLEESGSVHQKFCSLSQLFPQNPKWRMLIYGKPFFGKTQLCHDITGNWCLTDKSEREFANIDGFKILIHHCLTPESVKDLEKYLLDECHKMLPENYVSRNEFRKAWYTCMFGTLFILDGYDNLSGDEKQYVNLSLRQNFFQEASVLLTCRPNADNELKQSFNIHADICGLSKTILSQLLNYKSHYMNAFEDCKVENLYGIPSFYAQPVVNYFKLVDKPTLYDLINSVISFLTTSTKLNDLAFHIIGALFLKSLKNRNFVFQEKKLKKQLGKFWNDLQSFGLFVTCTRKPNETKKVVVFHKLFMVYFAVRYLRKEWANQRIPAQRDVFLKAQLCFEDCSGVYLETTEKTPRVYFAGVIPEIVFDFHKDAFQMIQDVSELDFSSAFEIQSLLLRVDSKRLSTFGITEVDDSNFENFFAEILNLLDFWGLTIEKRFYVAGNSPLYYLKIAVIDEDTNKQVMLSVASIDPTKGCQIREIHLDFLESNIKLIHSFLQKFVEKYLGLCQIDSNMSAVDLVFDLVLLCLACHDDLHTQLTLGSRSPKLSNLVTWEIMSSSCGEPVSSFSYLNENETILREYDSVECHNLPHNRSRVLERMYKTVRGFSELGITINVKSNI